MTWCRHHCRRCGSHFASLEALDATLHPCAFPDGVDLIETAGTCAIGDPTSPRGGVTVYRTLRPLRPGQYGEGRQATEDSRINPRHGVLAM